ncbi:hypothetical protein ACFPN4_07465 [Ureibacillus thermophilus]|uniref:hypothetical protein n=1 Tax=Ureibacillus thermophilus TaxID=367743 RepID=UPI001ABF5E40|nr:hypothetical protein [Ureibacillus thermophilus]
MSGKKAALILIGIIILVSILVIIVLSIFFAVYEPSINQTIQTFDWISSEKII